MTCAYVASFMLYVCSVSGITAYSIYYFIFKLSLIYISHYIANGVYTIHGCTGTLQFAPGTLT